MATTNNEVPLPSVNVLAPKRTYSDLLTECFSRIVNTSAEEVLRSCVFFEAKHFEQIKQVSSGEPTPRDSENTSLMSPQLNTATTSGNLSIPVDSLPNSPLPRNSVLDEQLSANPLAGNQLTRDQLPGSVPSSKLPQNPPEPIPALKIVVDAVSDTSQILFTRPGVTPVIASARTPSISPSPLPKNSSPFCNEVMFYRSIINLILEHLSTRARALPSKSRISLMSEDISIENKKIYIHHFIKCALSICYQTLEMTCYDEKNFIDTLKSLVKLGNENKINIKEIDEFIRYILKSLSEYLKSDYNDYQDRVENSWALVLFSLSTLLQKVKVNEELEMMRSKQAVRRQSSVGWGAYDLKDRERNEPGGLKLENSGQPNNQAAPAQVKKKCRCSVS